MKLKNIFSAGKMNKDSDERLVQNGEFRDALNVKVANSSGSDVGAVENEISNAVKLLNTFKSHFPDRIESFELMPKIFWEVAKNNIDNIVMPLENIPEMGVLIDVSSFSKNEITPNENGEIQIINQLKMY